MGKRLIIAEKPSVGRDIANVLGCRENGDGCRIGEQDIVTWAVGHLVGLCYPDEIDEKYAEWRMEDLPILPDPFPLKVLESSEKQYAIVSALMNDPSVDRIVCATDAGREGELIFRYIYQMAGCRKPVERLWISSLTFRAIREGFEHLRPDADYDNLYESARCRSEADWLIGMNGSRALAVANNMRRLSVGRVLSPTLAILVERELERRSFVPETYCEVIASFDGFQARLQNPAQASAGTLNASLEAAADEEGWSRFPAEQRAELEELVKKAAGAEAVVALAENSPESLPAPQLYDLTSLQRDANRIYGMSSQRTLDTAQSLYERHKAITYPRTDSRFLSADIKSTLPKRLESFLAGELEPFAAAAMISEKDLFGRFIADKGVTDHHAIIPTGEAKGMDTWTRQEKQIYDLISRRFLGMFFPDREVLRQKLQIDVDGHVFLAFGEKVLESGWSAVDTSRKSRLEELPALSAGDRIKVTGLRLRTDETRPPAPHTEASLLAAMEHAGRFVPEDSPEDVETEFGIGTPATRAATIEKLVDREMAVRRGRALIPTEYGIRLTGILPEVLRSPAMTGEWEAKLARIHKGEGSPETFMSEIRNLTREIVRYAADLGDTGIKNANSLGPCPVCGSPVREYERAYYCTNKDCGFRKIYKAAKGQYPTLQPVAMRALLQNGEAETEKGTYTLHREKPYITFAYAPKPEPDYAALHALIEDYGLAPVDKVANGGGLWLPGSRRDELMQDFLRDCRATGCSFDFTEDSRALKHKSGWSHRVEKENLEAYLEAFGGEKNSKVRKSRTDADAGKNAEDTDPVGERQGKKPRAGTDEVHDLDRTSGVPTSEMGSGSDGPDPVLERIRSSGLPFVDKRESGGSLWIIAGEEEGKALAEECKKLGTTFAFTPKGGRASKKQPAWYSVK